MRLSRIMKLLERCRVMVQGHYENESCIDSRLEYDSVGSLWTASISRISEPSQFSVQAKKAGNAVKMLKTLIIIKLGEVSNA